MSRWKKADWFECLLPGRSLSVGVTRVVRGRVVGIGVVAAAAVSITWWSLHSVSTPVVAPVQPPTASMLPVASESPPQDLPAAQPVEQAISPSQQPTPAPQSRRHRTQAPTQGLAEELNGLAQIRALLKAAPGRALAAVDEQQQRFAHGALTPERELLRLDALMRLGRVTQAQTLASQLMAAP